MPDETDVYKNIQRKISNLKNRQNELENYARLEKKYGKAYFKGLPVKSSEERREEYLQNQQKIVDLEREKAAALAKIPAKNVGVDVSSRKELQKVAQMSLKQGKLYAQKKDAAEKKKEELLLAKKKDEALLIAAEKKRRQEANKPYTGWQPRRWSDNGVFITKMQKLEEALDFDTNFDIFVTNEKSFKSGFLKFPIKYTPKENDKFVRKRKFTLDDSYFVSLAAAYVLANKCGFSRSHFLVPNQPKIVSCIARYFLYFHMHRFLQEPDRLASLFSEAETANIQRLIPVKKTWTRKFVDTKEIPILWWNRQKKKGREIREVHAEHYNGGGGQLGIVYHECTEETPLDEQNDFMQYIPTHSLGLTPLGTKYFQQAIESFVYSVLGSQARLRWDIVDAGARSLQTQDVFRKLVRDTILETDTTKSVSNMRQAIQDTNVVLNMCVSPGLILVPSDMIIVKEKTPGWNNILTLGTDKMQFGTNTEVNEKKATKTVPDPKKPEQKLADKQPEVHSRVKRSTANSQQPDNTKADASQYILLGVATRLIVKMIMMLL